MKTKLIIIITIFILSSSLSFANYTNCDQFEKLSAKYVECNAKKIKKDTVNKVEKSKKKFNNSALKKKLIKFKNSKNLMEFLEKD